MSEKSDMLGRDVRDLFFELLVELIEKEDSTVLLSVDMGAKALAKLSESARKRCFNVGVSEANAVTVAAGLSASGLIPFVYGLTPFLISRSRAQLRHDVAIGSRSIVIIGSGVGLTYAEDGPSHHSLDDIALVNTLPNFVIYTPVDETSAKEAISACSVKSGNSILVRLDKGPSFDPRVLGAEQHLTYECSSMLKISNRKRKAVITATPAVFASLLPEKHNDLFYLYRIDESSRAVLREQLKGYDEVTILDESSSYGGIFSLVSTGLYGMGVSLVDGSLDSRFIQEKWPRSELRAKYLSK